MAIRRCSEVRQERGIGPQRGVEPEIDLDVRVAVQPAGVVDIEAVENAIGELVVAGPVVGILKSLRTHAHHDAVATAGFVTSENVKVVQVRGLIFKQQRPISMAGGECTSAHDERSCAKS